MNPATPPSVIDLPNGHRLAYGEYGTPDGVPLLFCHGFPSSQSEALIIDEVGKSLGFRVIAPDRPGLGESSFVEGRKLLDWPADAAALMDKLAIDRFVLLGVSGGTPYSLACAHAIPERIRSYGIVCGLGPVYDLKARQTMRWPGRVSFGLALSAPGVLRALYGGPLGWLMRHRPELILALLLVACPPIDREVLKQPVVRRALRRAALGALREGTRGILHEFQIYAHPWGFDLGAIQVPVRIWHGDLDATVPLEHGKMLAAALPKAELTVMPGDGHFSLAVLRAEMMLRTLLAAAN